METLPNEETMEALRQQGINAAIETVQNNAGKQERALLFQGVRDPRHLQVVREPKLRLGRTGNSVNHFRSA